MFKFRQLSGYIKVLQLPSTRKIECLRFPEKKCLDLVVHFLLNDTILLATHYYNNTGNWTQTKLIPIPESVKLHQRYALGTLNIHVGLPFFGELLATYRHGRVFCSSCLVFSFLTNSFHRQSTRDVYVQRLSLYQHKHTILEDIHKSHCPERVWGLSSPNSFLTLHSSAHLGRFYSSEQMCTGGCVFLEKVLTAWLKARIRTQFLSCLLSSVV